MRSTVLLLLMLGTGSAAWADTKQADEASAAQQTQAAVVENPQKKSCRRIKVTGSHMKQKVCMSNASWQKVDEQQEKERRQTQSEMFDPGKSID